MKNKPAGGLGSRVVTELEIGKKSRTPRAGHPSRRSGADRPRARQPRTGSRGEEAEPRHSRRHAGLQRTGRRETNSNPNVMARGTQAMHGPPPESLRRKGETSCRTSEGTAPLSGPENDPRRTKDNEHKRRSTSRDSPRTGAECGPTRRRATNSSGIDAAMRGVIADPVARTQPRSVSLTIS